MSLKIRMQADDFFNAHQVLAQSEDLTTMGPGVVCLAFATELYIKDLHLALNGKAPRGHNLLKLYQKLPEKVQQQIFDYKAISGNPFVARGLPFSPKKMSSSYTAYDGFIDHIEAISDAFEKWRYSYERTTLKYEEWFTLAFIEAIKCVADARRIEELYNPISTQATIK